MDSVTTPSSMTTSPIMHQIDVHLNIAADNNSINFNNNDNDQDVCSICLDDFDSHHNPPTVCVYT